MGGVQVSSWSRGPPPCRLTIVCNPLPAGGVELGSTDLIFQSSDLTSTPPTTCIASTPPPPSSSISSVKLTPELVEEVLGRISNGGVVALAFFWWAEKQGGFKYTTESFHGLVEALGKIKQFRLVWNMVDAMKIKGLLTKVTFLLVAR